MPKSRRRQRAGDCARLPVAPPELEAAVEADRRFFERRPARSHCIRHTGRAEIAAAERAGCGLDPALPGFRWFTAVRQLAPGVRVRVYLQAPAMCETDVPEDMAAALYRRSEGRKARDVTASMVAALKAAGAL